MNVPPTTGSPAVAPAPEAEPEKLPSGRVANRPPFIASYPWIIALILTLTFIGIDGMARLATIQMISNSGVGGTPPLIADPNSLTGYYGNQHKLIMPAIGTDGYHWMMQTERMLAGKEGIRVRHTDYDNPPNGRDIHWSSLLHWVSGGLALAYAKINHVPPALGLAWDAPWANTLCLVVFILIIVPVTARRFGSVSASLLSLGFIAVYPYYEFSIVGYLDHHGLAASYDLGMVLFLVAGGAGWLRAEVAKPDRLSPAEKAVWEWLPERPQAKRWFIASAFMGGMALWISAASVVPAMVGVGLAALLGTGWMGRNLNPKSPWRVDPTLWRVWGIAGCLSSLFFYALEYMPSHFTWRLEVNHPLFAISWLGAGDILCRLCQYFNGSPLPAAAEKSSSKNKTFLQSAVEKQAASSAKPSLLPGWAWLVLDFIAVASIPAAVLLFPATRGYAGSDFIIPDHFLWSLHTDYIIEFRTLVRQLSQLSWQEIMGGISLVPLLSLMAVALLWRYDDAKGMKWPWRILLVGIIAVGYVFLLGVLSALIHDLFYHYYLTDPNNQDAVNQATTQAKSTANFLTPIVDVLVVFLLVVFPLTMDPAPDLPRPWKGLLVVALFPAVILMLLAFKEIRWLGIDCALWIAALVAVATVTARAGASFKWTTTREVMAGIFLALVVLPYPCFTIFQWIHFNYQYPVTMLDLTQVITRDVSQRLRARLGDDPGVIVSGPTTTTWMMYFGGFKGLGTLYWENIDGLKKVAAIYSAPSQEEALKLVKEYGVTHFAIYSWDPFADEYAKLYRGLRLNDETPTDSFIWQVLHSGKIPVWLRPLPYRMPQEGQLKGQYVMILEVALDQTPEEAAVRVAQFLSSQGMNDQAAIQLSAVLEQKPNYLPALVALARVEQSRGQTDAFSTTVQTIRDNLSQASSIPFADRVDLAVVFALINDRDEARKQMTNALLVANEKDVRHLQPDALINFFELTRQMNLANINPQMMQLAFNLLPLENQAQSLSAQASAEAQAGHFAEAISLYTQALNLQPNTYFVANNLALLLATAPDASIRNGTQALTIARKAADMDKYQHVESYDTLACAEAETGDFADAVVHARQALDLAQASNAGGNQTALLDALNKRLQAFQNHQAYHQEK
jgi:tetratricopeptide (TPR) repeat protein